MAYGACSKEVARSTADAPNVRWTQGIRGNRNARDVLFLAGCSLGGLARVWANSPSPEHRCSCDFGERDVGLGRYPGDVRADLGTITSIGLVAVL
jgi:hypothetical protein